MLVNCGQPVATYLNNKNENISNKKDTNITVQNKPKLLHNESCAVHHADRQTDTCSRQKGANRRRGLRHIRHPILTVNHPNGDQKSHLKVTVQRK